MRKIWDDGWQRRLDSLIIMNDKLSWRFQHWNNRVFINNWGRSIHFDEFLDRIWIPLWIDRALEQKFRGFFDSMTDVEPDLEAIPEIWGPVVPGRYYAGCPNCSLVYQWREWDYYECDMHIPGPTGDLYIARRDSLQGTELVESQHRIMVYVTTGNKAGSRVWEKFIHGFAWPNRTNLRGVRAARFTAEHKKEKERTRKLADEIRKTQIWDPNLTTTSGTASNPPPHTHWTTVTGTATDGNTAPTAEGWPDDQT